MKMGLKKTCVLSRLYKSLKTRSKVKTKESFTVKIKTEIEKSKFIEILWLELHKVSPTC
jgi:hypothetical protein